MSSKNWIFGLVVIIVAVVAIGIWGFGKSGQKNTAANSNSTATATYFDANAKVMYFYSDTCSHCIAQKPVLEELGKEGYRVKPMNVGENSALWDQLSQLAKTKDVGTPTFITDNGDKLVGTQNKDVLKAWLDQHK